MMDDAKKIEWLNHMKDESKKSMHDLAELHDYEIAKCGGNECKIMDYALAKVLQLGTSEDAANAIKLFAGYTFANQTASMLK